ncbi:MAG: molybdopterin-dependent oxidoreductase [Chloroflexi bacterium]|nr:molybdopterin-dependent oxidoreductase [Chloroflexota bacterium]
MPTNPLDHADTWVPSYDAQCNTGPCLMRVRRRNGVVVKIEGNPAFKDRVPGGGKVCVKALGLVQKLYNPHRIKAPMKRTNPEKGRGIDPKFVEISWDEALDIVARKLIEARSGGLIDPSGVPALAVSLGPGHNVNHSFGTLDAFERAWGPVDRTFGGGASVKCIHDEHLHGEYWHKGFMSGPDTPYCDWLLNCGHNTSASAGPPAQYRHGEARLRGLKEIQVEPYLSLTGAMADEWICIKPKTDAALLFAMMHVVLHELDWRKTCDTEFLKNRTNSPYLVWEDGHFARDAAGKPLVWDAARNAARPFDAGDLGDLALEGVFSVEGAAVRPAFQLLREHIKPHTPEWASEITGIWAETIRRLAGEYVSNASVGASVEIEGVKMPCRPVAIVLGKSVNNGPGAYHTVWAQHTLQTLVGALEVPGGLCGEYLIINPTPVKGNADGFIDFPVLPTSPESWKWPPERRDGLASLAILPGPTGGRGRAGSSHLSWLNMTSPPDNFPHFQPPRIWITYKTNPAVSMWGTQTVLEVLRKIPFQVSFAYTLDETNEFADVILPEHGELEQFHLCYQYPVRQWEVNYKYHGFALRQPVVPPLYNTRDMVDIWTDLAERVGILQAYNRAINEGYLMAMPLRAPLYDYHLDESRKHTREEIWDSVCRAATTSLSQGKVEHGLDWFQEHGAWLIPFSKTEGAMMASWFARPVYLHPTMEKMKLRYALPYQERLMRAGTELKQRLHEKGIHWWDAPLREYLHALPEWENFPALYDTGPEYDLWLITYRSMQYNLGGNVSLPQMAEVAKQVLGHNGVMINSRTAESRGIKNGDWILIESPVGRARGRAVLRQGVHPEVLVAPQIFGHWKTPVARDLGWPNLNQLTPIKYQLTNAGGSASDHVRVKISKLKNQ